MRKAPATRQKGLGCRSWLRVRTIGEQTVLERAVSGRGSEMDFSSQSEVPSDDVADHRVAAARRSMRRAFDVVTDDSRDALLTEFGKDTLRDRYLLPGRELSGFVRARRRGLCRRRRPRPARLRLHLQAVVHARDPGAQQRRHRPRPADQLLSQQRRRQPRQASSAPGTRTSGWPAAAAASALTGAACAASASRSASTARPAASSRSCG